LNSRKMNLAKLYGRDTLNGSPHDLKWPNVSLVIGNGKEKVCFFFLQSQQVRKSGALCEFLSHVAEFSRLSGAGLRKMGR